MGEGALVLMDELGTGTDPAEGAALARAILEALVERGARAIVTSHLGMLKRLDRTGSGIVNASLLFDPDRIEPTYQLLKGRPGRSYALAIARRLGFSPAVLDRAEEYVDSGELRIESLLESIERKEQELSEAVRDAAEALEEAKRLREEAEVRETRIDELERTAERRSREDARRLLLEARGEVEEAIRELRSASASAETPDDVAASASKARARVERAAREQGKRLDERGTSSPSRRDSQGEERFRALVEGDPVRLVSSGSTGVVREVREDRVLVEVGGMRLRLTPDAIEPISAREANEVRRGKKAAEPLLRGWSGPEVEVKLEADLRGLRVDEVELGIGRALDGAVLGNLTELRIIHGKGTGAVKARVLDLLRLDPRVREFRPGGEGEGGSGVTVAVLK
jgi:DNA mismatch repair protein MutS2